MLDLTWRQTRMAPPSFWQIKSLRKEWQESRGVWFIFTNHCASYHGYSTNLFYRMTSNSEWLASDYNTEVRVLIALIWHLTKVTRLEVLFSRAWVCVSMSMCSGAWGPELGFRLRLRFGIGNSNKENYSELCRYIISCKLMVRHKASTMD